MVLSFANRSFSTLLYVQGCSELTLFFITSKVIIVTSSLMKDMNSRTDMYRANAIRVLCRIIDGTLLTQIERYLKQAIVDKNPVVASASLVSGIHLLQVLLDV